MIMIILFSILDNFLSQTHKGKLAETVIIESQ